MGREWVVLIEAERDAAGGAIDRMDIEELLEVLCPDGSALHCPNRYALQMKLTGTYPADVLVDVLARWGDAVRQLGLPVWDIVRAEVFTPEDLDRELQKAHGEDIPVFRSAVERARAQSDAIGQQLLHEAFSDPLTGLLSREAFAHRLDVALAGTPARRCVGVVRLDLDAFHSINDRFGWATGDLVLVELAQRLAAMLRPEDALARLGADEYCLLVQDTTAEAALKVAGRMLATVGRPLEIDGEQFSISGTAGVAVGAVEDCAETLLRNADAALGVGKAAGGGCPVLRQAGMASPGQAPEVFATGALQDRLAHILLMQEAAIAANEAPTLDDAAQMVMRQMCAHIGCVIGHLWASTVAGSGELAPTSVWSMADTGAYRAFRAATEEEVLVGPGAGLPGRVLATGRPVWISELAIDGNFSCWEEAVDAGLQSAFAFPVLVRHEVVAVLEFFSRTHMEPTVPFLDVLASIGTQLGRVVERQ
jgi:diguanylate cyclase (GGDEF)-like protein